MPFFDVGKLNSCKLQKFWILIEWTTLAIELSSVNLFVINKNNKYFITYSYSFLKIYILSQHSQKLVLGCTIVGEIYKIFVADIFYPLQSTLVQRLMLINW